MLSEIIDKNSAILARGFEELDRLTAVLERLNSRSEKMAKPDVKSRPLPPDSSLASAA